MDTTSELIVPVPDGFPSARPKYKDRWWVDGKRYMLTCKGVVVKELLERRNLTGKNAHSKELLTNTVSGIQTRIDLPNEVAEQLHKYLQGRIAFLTREARKQKHGWQYSDGQLLKELMWIQERTEVELVAYKPLILTDEPDMSTLGSLTASQTSSDPRSHMSHDTGTTGRSGRPNKSGRGHAGIRSVEETITGSIQSMDSNNSLSDQQGNSTEPVKSSKYAFPIRSTRRGEY